MRTASQLITMYNIQRTGPDSLRITGRRMTDAEMAELKAAKQAILDEFDRRDAERAAIIRNEQPIVLRWHESEYLSDWEVTGEAVSVLDELGLIRFLPTWGYVLIRPAARELGHEFTYREAVALADRLRAEGDGEDVTAAVEQARTSGKPVMIRTWTEPCDRDDCSLDTHSEWALPDGTIEHRSQHTY